MFENATKGLAGVGTLVGCVLVMVLYVCGFCVMVHDFVQYPQAVEGQPLEAVDAGKLACDQPFKC